MTAEEIQQNDAMVGRAARRHDQARKKLEELNERLNAYRAQIGRAAASLDEMQPINAGRGVKLASRDELLSWPTVEEVGQVLHELNQAEIEIRNAENDLRRLGLTP